MVRQVAAIVGMSVWKLLTFYDYEITIQASGLIPKLAHRSGGRPPRIHLR